MRKVIGIVQRTGKDKNGTPIAAVLPLIEVQKEEWRTIDALEEFPTRGQVFWFAASAAVADTFVRFRAEPNPGQKDQFRLVDPDPIFEVLDLRRFGTASDVRVALTTGLRLPGPSGSFRALVWCKPDLLVGPVSLTRMPDDTLRLAVAARPRVPSFVGSASIRAISVNGHERWIRTDDRAPSGFVDWDDDITVLRRAIEAAIRVATQAGHERTVTKKQIEEAARAIATQGVGADAQLDADRLARALELIEHTDVVAQRADDIAAQLLEHPAIKASLGTLSQQVAADVERTVRATLEQQLAGERDALRQAAEASAEMKLRLEAIEREVRDAEVTVNARVGAALERPLDLLAEAAVLRPFLSSSRFGVDATAAVVAPSTNPMWSRGPDAKDKVSFRRSLTTAARATGVDPALMLHIHAAIAARLMPVTLGPAALGALTAYVNGACGGRLLIMHVLPSTIHHQEIEHGVAGALSAVSPKPGDIDGVSVVILEGANRSALEASVVPLLQLADLGLSSLSSTPGIRLATALVSGATTVPVTPQLWSHAVAIYPEPTSMSVESGPKGDLSLSSELFALGDEPTSAIDALIDAWPDCRELRPVMSRFGSALRRLYDDEPRISEAIVNGVVLPYAATSFTAEELSEILSRVKDDDGAMAATLRRLRKKLT